MGGIKGMALHLYPLQLPQFYRETNSRDAIIFVGGVILLIIVLIIVNIVRRRYAIPGVSEQGGGSAPRHFSVMTLHRLANGIGLDKDQTKMLEFVLKTDHVVDPERSIQSANLLDRHFKKAYRIIERGADTEEDAQQRIALLFSTRNILEAAQNSAGGANSTRQIAENTAAVLSVNAESYPVKVISTKGDNLVVETPKNALGTPVRLPRGGKAILSFFTKSSRGFSFESRILGTADSADGPVLQLVHSSQVKRLSQRRFRRRQAYIPTNFYFVYLEDAGRKKEKKMVVDRRRLSGNIMDISIGGCSIKTNVSIQSGARLKIEFMQNGNPNVAVLGQVLRTNRNGLSTVMHVKFLKVPRRSLTAINALVFEYSDE
jgi:c-di-GMP-binding flagellar brake protein YcgR